ncbi:MAG: deoxyribose-phosphate aldolase [Propionibacteriaceae bacterium]|nr:deoxyribose-phosphate aldolase [Micropruina sp.]HBX81073.1 deoxyribose-phosphate aldolase [Propionibacteriaceae bacterium]HBY24711.1 deoxyribose-phosphate aldolase [Propionibacteriaceae bacterium]
MIDFQDRDQVAKAIQYTNVNPDLTRDGVVAHLEQCVHYGFDAAMIGPCWVPLAREVLAGTGVKVASTLNFPMANDTLDMKIAALRALAAAGADQFDFPPNPGYLLGGMEEEYRREMNEIARIAHAEGMVLKAMLEFGFLPTDDLKVRATRAAFEAGIDWVKQSSGWGKGGCEATTHDVALLAANIELPCRVKVSGKVNTREKMQAMFEAGAELVGTSSGPAIVDGIVGDPNAY